MSLSKLFVFNWCPASLFLLAGVIGMGINADIYYDVLQDIQFASLIFFPAGVIGAWFWGYKWFRQFSIIIFSAILIAFLNYRYEYLYYSLSLVILAVMIFGIFDKENPYLYRSLFRNISFPCILLWLYMAYSSYVGCFGGGACESPALLIPIFFLLFWIALGFIVWAVKAAIFSLKRDASVI